MSGMYNGVQKNICDIIPQALYVHCATHSLNLTFSRSCDIQEIKNCIGSISTITSFFRKSSIRSEVLKKFIRNQQTLIYYSPYKRIIIIYYFYFGHKYTNIYNLILHKI